MPLSTLQVGDEVAILPALSAPPSDVVEIAKVLYVGRTLVLLEGGRCFSNLGCALNADRPSFIVPATDQHREALKAQQT